MQKFREVKLVKYNKIRKLIIDEKARGVNSTFTESAREKLRDLPTAKTNDIIELNHTEQFVFWTQLQDFKSDFSKIKIV